MVGVRSHRNVVRCLAGGLLAAATGVSLTGCEAVFEDAPSASVVVGIRDGVVAVTNCGPEVAADWELSLGISGDSYDEFFVAVSHDSWAPGAVVVADSDAWAEVKQSSQPTLTPTSPFAVWVVSGAGTKVARFTIPQRGLPQGAWLHPDGSITGNPCEMASSGQPGS